MLAAILHTMAFAICLNVQSLNSPLAGAWLFFHIAGCVALLYNGRYERRRGPVWWSALAWLLTLGVSAFLIVPVGGGAATMWVLMAMPSLALCLREEHIKYYTIGFGVVIALYALGLILQMLLHVTYDSYNLGTIYAWPLLDPNNAATVINLGLIPALYLALFRDLRWWLLCALFLAAMYATGSKAGWGEFGLALIGLTSYRYGAETFLFWLVLCMAATACAFYGHPEWIVTVTHSLEDRFPIWEGASRLLWIRPFTGLGLGTFGAYYPYVRVEQYTQGSYAHNDVLQFAIEMGIPCAGVFVFLAIAVAAATHRSNLISAATIFAVLLGSMVEFQLYVPAVSLPLALALGHHIVNRRQSIDTVAFGGKIRATRW